MPLDEQMRAVLADAARRPEADPAAGIDDAVASRRSVRAFLPTPVPEALVRHMLEVAARAPSGTNMQPWRVYVVGPQSRAPMCAETVAAALTGTPPREPEYEYYPKEFPEPYLSRRRTVGWGLYGTLGIQKGDTQRMAVQGARNYTFFDAPVAMICTIDRRLEMGSWLDYGFFLEGLAVSARGHGLHTCFQAAWTHYHRIVRRHVPIPDIEAVVCGVALGYEDTSKPENSLRTERAPLAEWATFVP